MGQHGRAASGEEISVRVSNLLWGGGVEIYTECSSNGWHLGVGGFATLGSRELRNAFDEASF